MSKQTQRLVLKDQPSNPMRLLNQVRDWAFGQRWDDVRVSIKMPEQRTRVVQLGRETEAADVLFVRSEEVALAEGMEICTDAVNEGLYAEALAVFSKDDWR